MTKAKRLIASILTFALIFCTVFCTCVPASAATCSSGTQTRTITVKTKANYWIPGSESVTLSQAKGVCTKYTYNPFNGRTSTKTSNQYGKWNVVAKATDGSHTLKKTLSGSSVKLNLKPNKTYKITVSWDHQAEIFKELDKGNYTRFPTWKVKSTWKVSSYF